METERITIFDTTLRDGEQAPGCSMDAGEKVKLARQIEALGVDVIEAGFPVASEGDFEAVRAVAAACRRASIAALARASEGDVRRAWQALEGAARPRVHVFVATSDLHLEYKLKKTRAEVLDAAFDAVRLARSLCDDVEFSAEDATRSDVDFLCAVLEAAVAGGASTLNIPDTVGYTTPTEYREIVAAVRDRVVGGRAASERAESEGAPGGRAARRRAGARAVTLSVHCHDDLGLAVANSLAALDAGARQIECTVNGIGERAGNAALEEVVMATRVRADRLPYSTGIDAALLYPTSRLLSSIVGFETQPNKAVVGRNAFAHEAGIHQHGVLSNPLCYEIMTPESVGVPSNRIVLGKHSGRHALAARMAELGHELSRPELGRVYERFAALADRKKRIYDQDLLSLLSPETARRPTAASAARRSTERASRPHA